MRYYIKRHSHRIKNGIFGLVIIASTYFGLRYFLNTRGVVVKTDDSIQSEQVGAEDVVQLKTKILNFGSVSWAEAETDNLSQTSMLSSLQQFNRSDYGTWIGNLDCFISQTKSAASCSDDNVGSFSKWFNIVALGGLRSSDGKGDLFTADKLSKNNIQYFGRTSNSRVPEDCEIVSLPANYVLKDQSLKQATMPLALCAVDGERTILQDIVTEIKRYSDALPVWVYALDTGAASDAARQSQYRAYIDAGADLVMGVSSNDLGTSEIYGEKLIMYSLGNFVGPDDNPASSKGAVLLAVEITATNDELVEWDKIAKTCSGYDDLCLDAVRSMGLKKMGVDYVYGVVAVDTSNPRSPMVAGSALTADVLGKLGWYDTSALLRSE